RSAFRSPTTDAATTTFCFVPERTTTMFRLSSFHFSAEARLISAAIGALLVLAACGSSSASDPPTDPGGDGAAGDSASDSGGDETADGALAPGETTSSAKNGPSNGAGGRGKVGSGGAGNTADVAGAENASGGSMCNQPIAENMGACNRTFPSTSIAAM